MTSPNYELGGEEFFLDVLIMCIPICGLFCGVVFGGLDLEHKFSRTQGIVRLFSAIGSHTLYAALILQI